MKWEYLIYPINEGHFINDINRLGQRGWEMCVIDNNNVYFKRPLENVSKMNIIKDFGILQDGVLAKGRQLQDKRFEDAE